MTSGGLGPFAVPETAAARTGSLLVAEPRMHDPNIDGSVVLLLNHSEEGSLGVVLNRPTRASVDSVLPGWADHVSGPQLLFQGGPVGLNSAIGVAVLPGDGDDPLGVRRLVGAFALVDLDAPPEVVRPSVAGLRVFVGHSGWGAGQLDDEIAEGAWFVVAAEPGDVMAPDAEALRRSVLRRQPSGLALLSTFPDSPGQVVDN